MDEFALNATGGALPSWWYGQQEALGQKCATRMRALGVTTILRGFEGNVPGGYKETRCPLQPRKCGSSRWKDAFFPGGWFGGGIRVSLPLQQREVTCCHQRRLQMLCILARSYEYADMLTC